MNAHKKAGYEKKLEDVSKPPNGTEEHYLALKRLLKDIEGDLYLTNFMSYWSDPHPSDPHFYVRVTFYLII